MCEMLVCFIIPTLNECWTIKKLVEEIQDLNLPCKLIIVDDGSIDGSLAILEDISRIYDNIILVERERKLGFGSALITGFKESLKLNPKPSYIVTLDADFSHNSKYIPELIKACKYKDISIGSRYIKNGKVVNWKFHRRLMSLTANFLPRILFRLPIRDLTSGFKCYNRNVINALTPGLTSSGYDIQLETVYKAHKSGFKITEVPITFIDRKHGESKLGFKEVLSYIKSLASLRKGGIP